jgi:hypothetical protein
MTAGERTYSGRGMSNCDHRIDDGLEEDLRAGMYSEHYAWNFCGTLWYDAEAAVFKEDVFVYHASQGIRSAATLEELMRAVNDEFGRD